MTMTRHECEREDLSERTQRLHLVALAEHHNITTVMLCDCEHCRNVPAYDLARTLGLVPETWPHRCTACGMSMVPTARLMVGDYWAQNAAAAMRQRFVTPEVALSFLRDCAGDRAGHVLRKLQGVTGFAGTGRTLVCDQCIIDASVRPRASA